MTGAPLKVVARKLLKIGFSPEEEEHFEHPFVIVPEGDQLLISSVIMYKRRIGIEWPDKGEVPMLKWRSARDGAIQYAQMHDRSRYDSGTNDSKICLEAGQEKLITLVTRQRPTEEMSVIVNNVPDQLALPCHVRSVILTPSLSFIDKSGRCAVIATNTSKKPVTTFEGQLLCRVEGLPDSSDWEIKTVHKKAALEEMSDLKVGMQTISHLPRSSRKYLSEREDILCKKKDQHSKNQGLKRITPI